MIEVERGTEERRSRTRECLKRHQEFNSKYKSSSTCSERHEVRYQRSQREAREKRVEIASLLYANRGMEKVAAKSSGSV